jgi:hypothetical protein
MKDKEDFRVLAEQVLRDRLVGFKLVDGKTKGRVGVKRVLAPTEAEVRWDALATRPRPEPTFFNVHPGVLALAVALKAAKR